MQKSNFTRAALVQCCFLLLATLFVHAQSRTIQGRVTSADNNDPIGGASVQIKGSSTGTTTAMDGTYSIQVPSGQNELNFSATSHAPLTVAIAGKTTIDVTLTATENALDEVVIIGYGREQKSDLTGSVGKVTAVQLRERPSTSVNQAIAGRMAGVQVNTNSGRPGGQTTVRIRGFSSINSSNNPLYVVDGVFLPTATQTQKSNIIDFVNPGDIESVTVLKDASATAIYGARGANGVVLITTKRGVAGASRVTYDADFSVPFIGPSRVRSLSAGEYIQVEDLAYDNIKVYDPVGWANGSYNSLVDPRIKRKSLPLLFDADGQPLYNTDWLKESTQNKLTQNHQLGVSGGNDKTTFGAFIGFRDENGLLLNSTLKRYSARFNMDTKITPWLKMGGGISYNNQKDNLVDEATGGLNAVRMITEAFSFLPVKYPDGSWAENYQYPGAEGGSNPVHLLNDRKVGLDVQTMIGNFQVSIDLGKGFELRSQVGASMVNRLSQVYSGRTLDQISRDEQGVADITYRKETYWSNENFITYNKKIGKNQVLNALGGVSWQGTSLFFTGATAFGYSTDYFEANNIGAGSIQLGGRSSLTAFAFNSYFGRVNYSISDKYLFTLTARSDGSSKFGSNNKYALFPSAAAAWRISEEDFLKNSNLISNLKIRASHGITGNSEIAPYSSDALLGASYIAVLNNQRVVGVGTNRLANSNLQWEKTAQSDMGLEIGLLNNRINIEADLYYRKTTDMLLQAPLPRSSGFSSITNNIGSMENKGFELALNTTNVNTKDFSWQTTLTYSANKNKVLSLATEAPIFSGNPNFVNNTGIIQVGEPVASFYGLTRLGVWTEAERDEAAKFASYRGGKPILPGDVKYLDVNGDYVINDADRGIIGNGSPKGWGSFINNFRFKQFDLLLDIQYTYGNDVLNQTIATGEDRVGIANSFKTVLNAYDPAKASTDNTMVAAIRDTRAGYVLSVDSHWVEDGSFIRGRNVMLSYTLTKAITDRLHLSKLRFYVSAQNFFLITKYTGNDPEVSTYTEAFSQGQTFFDYPKPTTVMFGLNVGL